jgi:alpha-N-acetylglucosamine transferase
MTGFYDLLNKLKVHFDSDPIVNSVTQGDIFQVDLNKQTIFPLTHIMVNSSTLGDNTMSFNVSILAMDIVDISKSEVVDVFQENNNELDVLNTQHAVLNRAYQQMLHGNLWDAKYVIETDPTLEPFTERFENLLAGWTMTFDVVVPNEMTIC